MAEGTKLVLTFITDQDRTSTVTFKYAKPSATLAQVKTAAQALITNTATLETQLVALKAAKTVTTTETAYDISANFTGDPNTYTGVPMYQALKEGIISEEDAEHSLNDYDENGKLRDTSSPVPENLKITRA